MQCVNCRIYRNLQLFGVQRFAEILGETERFIDKDVSELIRTGDTGGTRRRHTQRKVTNLSVIVSRNGRGKVQACSRPTASVSIIDILFVAAKRPSLITRIKDSL